MAKTDSFVKSAWTLGAIAVVVAVLYLAKGLLVPLALAVLLSFMLSPVCDWLERRGLSRIPAVFITALLGFSLLGMLAWAAAVQIADLAPKIPEYQANLQTRLHSVNDYFVSSLGKLTKTAEALGETVPEADQAGPPQGTRERPYSVRVISSPSSPLQVVSGSFGTVAQALGFAGIVIVLVIFVLVRREDLRDRFIWLVGTGQVTASMLEDAATRVSRYLAMLFVINGTYGLAVGIGLYLIGVPNAILWGILAATLRFVPYIGPWIAAAMPIGLSLANSADWVAPVLTVLLFVALELFSNNVMEPWLYGSRTGMSAVAVLVAAVFWTWLWGIAGLLLATPLTVCLLVLGKHIPQLAFLDILLGNEPVFEPRRRVYQRLLAGDQEEAAELFEESLEKMSLVEAYDTLLIPALALAEADWHAGDLDPTQHALILQSLVDMIREGETSLGDMQAKEGVEMDHPPRPCIVCLSARDQADEIAGMMLGQLLAAGEVSVRSLPFSTADDAVLGDLERHAPDIVCISATPPAAVMRARRVCRRVRSRFPNLPLVVGLWDAKGDLAAAKTRIGDGAMTHVVTTLAEAQEQVHRLLEPRLPTAAQPSQPGSESLVIEAGRAAPA